MTFLADFLSLGNMSQDKYWMMSLKETSFLCSSLSCCLLTLTLKSEIALSLITLTKGSISLCFGNLYLNLFTFLNKGLISWGLLCSESGTYISSAVGKISKSKSCCPLSLSIDSLTLGLSPLYFCLSRSMKVLGTLVGTFVGSLGATTWGSTETGLLLN